MSVQRILSRNADFQRMLALRDNRTRRLREGLLWVEGVRNINAALSQGWEVEGLLYARNVELSRWAQEKIASLPRAMGYQLSPDLLAELSNKEEPSELLALVRMRPRVLAEYLPEPQSLTALFDRPANRGNLGTLIRSCDALGVSALIIIGHGVDVHDPETIVASMGSYFAVPIFRAESITELEEWITAQRQRLHDFQVVGTSAHGSEPLHKLNLAHSSLLMVGNETNGLSRRLVETCDLLARIPMRNESIATSLNVACAGTVLFYEAQRQRDLLAER